MTRHALLLFATSCTASPGTVSLLDPAALRPVEATADPLDHHRPSDLLCPEAAWGPEAGAFEVQTGVCDYAAFAHPLVVPLDEGDRLDIGIWHDQLDAADPGTGHVAVLLGREVVWEESVPIPAPSAERGGIVELEWAPDPDAQLSLHLHNHGYNNWRFLKVDRLD